MNFLVTGGCGYIGSVFVEVATAAGHHCLVIDRAPALATFPPTVRYLQSYLGVDPLENELIASIKDFRPHSVHHFAAISTVAGVAAFAYQENRASTQALLTILSKSAPQATIVFASTCAVFGNATNSSVSSQHAPVSEYGHSKSQCEQLLAEPHRTANQQVAIMRYTNVGGATAQHGEQRKTETHLIPTLIDAALHDRRVTIFGQNLPTSDGSCERDYVHVLDIVHAHLLASSAFATKTLTAGCHAFHLGNGKTHSNLAVARRVEFICNAKLTMQQTASRPGDAVSVSLDYQHAQAVLGYRPHHPALDEIIRSTYLYRRCKS